MLLTTLDALQKFQSFSEAANTAVTEAAEAAEGWIISQGIPTPQTTARTERYSGGSAIISPRAKPVATVTSLTVDGASWDVLTDTGTDTGQPAYLQSDGLAIRARWPGSFPRGTGNIVLVYSGLLDVAAASMPSDLQWCVHVLTQVCLAERNRAGMTGKSLGPEKISQLARAMTDYPAILAILNKYGRAWAW